MSKINAPEKLFVDGKRLDGRDLEDFREMHVEVGNLKKAMGSGLWKFGDTFALAAVYGPKSFHPRHLQNPQKAILRCKYSMAPFSTMERIKPGPSRRSTEISMVIKKALSSVIFFEDFPKTGIDVFMEVLQADASTRTAALNAASLALADAGIPMKDLISSCAVGKVEGKLILDLDGPEDMYGDVDLAVAMIGNEDKFVLMQMDGILTRKEFSKLLEMAREGCSQIYERQKEILKERYETGDLDVDND